MEAQGRSAQKRAAVLKAAKACFSDRGYSGTSMDEVALQAQVSKRTVYNHFESKLVLFQAVAAELFQQADAAIQTEYNPASGIRVQLSALAARKLKLNQDPNFLGLFRAIFADFARDPQLAAETMARTQRGEGSLVKLLRAAHQDGKLKTPDPEKAATKFWALLKGEGFWPQLMGHQLDASPEENQRLIDETVDIFMKYFGP